MAKRRKTREEKILSDIRKMQQHTAPSSITFSLPSTYEIETKKHDMSQSFPYQHDLQKTLFVSISIIFLQLFLFSLLKLHIVPMPFASLQ